jgi:hypothetical protein
VLKSAAERGTLACAALACRRCIRVVKIDIGMGTFLIFVELANVVLYIISSIANAVDFKFTSKQTGRQ